MTITIYNYSNSSNEVQPLLDLEPVQGRDRARLPAPSLAEVRRGNQQGDGDAPPLTTFHISPQSVSLYASAPPELAAHVDRLKRIRRVESISPVVSRPGSFSIWVEGSLMNVKAPRNFVTGRKHLCLRGRVCGFSAGSRRRMQRRCAKLKSSARPLFVTLTYPGEFSRDWREWKNDLDKFARRLGRRFPGASAIWRLEPQRRMAPHFHLLIFGVSPASVNVSWLKMAWYGCVGSGDERHLVHGVNVEPIKSSRGVKSYVSKYIAKKQLIPDDDQEIDWSMVGRWWGVLFAKNLPESEVFAASGLTGVESSKLLRAMRKFLLSRGCRVSGCLRGLTMFTEAPRQWLDAIDGLAGGVYRGAGSFLSIGRGSP